MESAADDPVPPRPPSDQRRTVVASSGVVTRLASPDYPQEPPPAWSNTVASPLSVQQDTMELGDQANENGGTDSRRRRGVHPERERRRSARHNAGSPGGGEGGEVAAAGAGGDPAPGPASPLGQSYAQLRPEVMELRRLRAEYHNRPRYSLDKPPQQLVAPLLNRESWLQPLCYAPLYFPCMDNASPALRGPRRKPSSVLSLRDATSRSGSDVAGQRAGAARGAGTADAAGATPPQSSLGNTPQTNPLLSPSSPHLSMTRDENTGTNSAVRQVGFASTATGGAPRSSPVPRPQGGLTSAEVFIGNGDAPPPQQQRGASTFRQHRSRPGEDLYHQPIDISQHGEPFSEATDLGSSGTTSDHCMHLLRRCFCVRCSIAQETYLLFREEERRRREPYRFCCEGFFGADGDYQRTLLLMCLLDTVTIGMPCGCWYHGLGTALFGWRIRYLLRCRYRVQGLAIMDCLIMCCMPMNAIDQQASEMAANGIIEVPGVCPAVMK